MPCSNRAWVQRVPSAERLRQRLDEHAEQVLTVIDEAREAFLANARVPVSPMALGRVALDIDCVEEGVDFLIKWTPASRPSSTGGTMLRPMGSAKSPVRASGWPCSQSLKSRPTRASATGFAA